MIDVLVFTEIVNCAKIGRIALQSYLRYHGFSVHVFGTQYDFQELGDIGDDRRIIKIVVPNESVEEFKKGHAGTAAIFASACKIGASKICHFDSDVYFREEVFSEIITELCSGYDIVGTRRCYGNNPGGVTGLHNFPDTISTYVMGMNISELLSFDLAPLTRMWQGAWHPLGWPILDFADAITHWLLHKGAKMKFLDWNEYGSQNEHGKKTNNYELNLHMDAGSKLIHMGGVASGYSYFNKLSSPERLYGEWALGRYALFAKVFYDEDIGYNEPTVYGPDGRWINGSYDDHILHLFKKEIA